MTISLNRFTTGQVTYIAAHNTNCTTIETAINALQAATTIGVGGTGANAIGFTELWDRDGIVGASSFPVTCATSLTLSVGSGGGWLLGQQTFARATSALTLNFAGKGSGIYGIILDAAGGLSISALSATVAGSSLQIFSVQFNAPDFGSAARLLPILMQGDDWNRMLSSTQYGSFTRIADRFSAIEGALTVDALYAQSGISGTGWSFKAGHLRNNNAIVSTAAGNLTLAGSATHYVEVAISTGAVSYASGGWTSSEAIALRLITTAASAVTVNNDVRTWAIAGAGSGGGVPGLANSGTTDGLWQLYRGTGAGSALPSTAVLAVDRGSLTDVAIRFNPSAGASGAWQYSDDGTTYYRFGEIAGIDLGAGQTTRFTMIASAPAILAATLSSTSGYALISLSGTVSTTTTAVFLRGTAFDSAASAIGGSAEPFPGIAFYRDSSTVTADAVAKIYAWFTSGQPERPQVVVCPVSNAVIQYQAWAASQGSLRVSVYAFAMVDLVVGPGPQPASATVVSLTASVGGNTYALSSGQFSGFLNRGLVTYLETSGTIGAGSLYDVEFYASNGNAASQLLFQAVGIEASSVYTTRIPFSIKSVPSNNTTFLRISNMGASAGLFSFFWQAERFA